MGGRTVIRDNVLYGPGSGYWPSYGDADADVVYNHIHSSSSHGISIYNHDGLSDHDGRKATSSSRTISFATTRTRASVMRRRSVCVTAAAIGVQQRNRIQRRSRIIHLAGLGHSNNIAVPKRFAGTERTAAVQVYIDGRPCPTRILDGNILTDRMDRPTGNPITRVRTARWHGCAEHYVRQAFAGGRSRFVDAAGADSPADVGVAVDAGLDVGDGGFRPQSCACGPRRGHRSV